jgi:hypothetical protein
VVPTASPHLPRHHPVITGRSLGAGGERSEARDAAASTVVGACDAVGARVGRHRPARRGAIRLRSGCDRPSRKAAARAAQVERSTAPEGAMSLRVSKIPGPSGAIQPAAFAFTERRIKDIGSMYSMRRGEQPAVQQWESCRCRGIAPPVVALFKTHHHFAFSFLDERREHGNQARSHSAAR